MHYRIVEFTVANDDGNRFFLEIGHKYKEHFWAFIYLNKIRWDLHSGHKTWDEAMKAFDVLKQTEPVYHRVK